MKKLNKKQISGIAIIISGLIMNQFVESVYIEVISGVLCAIGFSLLIKILPFIKKSAKTE